MWSTALSPAWTPTKVLSSSNPNITKRTTRSFYHCHSVSINNGMGRYRPKSNLSLNCSINQKATSAKYRLKSNFPLNCSTNHGATGENLHHDQQLQANSAEFKPKPAKFGLGDVLAYGLFEGVTCFAVYVFAFDGYKQCIGKNPAANLNELFWGIAILFWLGNNITRLIRVAGATALSPFMNRVLKKIWNHFKAWWLVYALMLVVYIVALSCYCIYLAIYIIPVVLATELCKFAVCLLTPILVPLLILSRSL